MDRLILVLLFMSAPLLARSAGIPKSVFIHAECDGTISSAVLSSLREGIRTSPKYQLVRTLEDDRHMGIVLSIYMNCAERNDVSAVAIAYGAAQCYSEKNCHLSIDGHSIRSTLCDHSAAAECGRELFKAFDDYVNGPNKALLKLN